MKQTIRISACVCLTCSCSIPAVAALCVCAAIVLSSDTGGPLPLLPTEIKEIIIMGWSGITLTILIIKKCT